MGGPTYWASQRPKAPGELDWSDLGTQVGFSGIPRHPAQDLEELSLERNLEVEFAVHKARPIAKPPAKPPPARLLGPKAPAYPPPDHFLDPPVPKARPQGSILGIPKAKDSGGSFKRGHWLKLLSFKPKANGQRPKPKVGRFAKSNAHGIIRRVLAKAKAGRVLTWPTHLAAAQADRAAGPRCPAVKGAQAKAPEGPELQRVGAPSSASSNEPYPGIPSVQISLFGNDRSRSRPRRRAQAEEDEVFHARRSDRSRSRSRRSAQAERSPMQMDAPYVDESYACWEMPKPKPNPQE